MPRSKRYCSRLTRSITRPRAARPGCRRRRGWSPTFRPPSRRPRRSFGLQAPTVRCLVLPPLRRLSFGWSWVPPFWLLLFRESYDDVSAVRKKHRDRVSVGGVRWADQIDVEVRHGVPEQFVDEVGEARRVRATL